MLALGHVTAAFVSVVLCCHNQHQMAGNPPIPHLIAGEVNSVPVDPWESGIKRRTGLQQSPSRRSGQAAGRSGRQFGHYSS